MGKKIKFVYDDVEGEFEILNHKSDKNGGLTIKYNDKVINMKSTNLINCYFKNILPKKNI